MASASSRLSECAVQAPRAAVGLIPSNPSGLLAVELERRECDHLALTAVREREPVLEPGR